MMYPSACCQEGVDICIAGLGVTLVESLFLEIQQRRLPAEVHSVYVTAFQIMNETIQDLLQTHGAEADTKQRKKGKEACRKGMLKGMSCAFTPGPLCSLCCAVLCNLPWPQQHSMQAPVQLLKACASCCHAALFSQQTSEACFMLLLGVEVLPSFLAACCAALDIFTKTAAEMCKLLYTQVAASLTGMMSLWTNRSALGSPT